MAPDVSSVLSPRGLAGFLESSLALGGAETNAILGGG